MSEDSTGPSEPTFRTGLRGYERAQVDAFVADIQARVEGLEKERDLLQARLSDLGEEGSGDLKAEIEAVGAEVQAVLDAAQEAAEGMRARASDDASRWRADADAEARQARTEAQSDAELLRGSAWETGTRMLEQAKRYRDQLVRRADEEALSIRATGEQDAHRHVASARREMEEESRRARMQSEKMLVRAKAESETLVENARREAEAAQERARVLEERRGELMAELETAQAAISQFESELEAKRASLSTAGTAPSTSVRVIPTEEPNQRGYFDEEQKVRVVSTTSLDELEPVDADDMVAEVERLHEQREAAAEAPEPASEPVLTAAPEPAIAAVSESAPEPGPVAASEPEPAGDELEDLFTSLRAVDDPPSGNGVTPADGIAAGLAVAPLQVVTGVDPFDLRDRLLLPVTNRALRELKRQIVDLQNIVLEEMRTQGDDFNPDRAEFESVLGDAVRTLAAESLVAGFTASAELSGATTTPRPEVEAPDPTSEVAGGLFDEAIQVMARSRQAEASNRQLASAVSRVFRTWRTDGAERWLRAASFASYHEGLLWGLAELGTERVQGIVSGSSCSECPARIGEAWAPGEALPEGTGIPPVHVDCECSLVPVS